MNLYRSELSKNSESISTQLAFCFFHGDRELFNKLINFLLKDVNKDELVRRSGVPKSTIRRLLLGENVTIDNFFRVLKALSEEI